MHLIEQTLLSAINKHPETPLVIAYSGGVDSQVLLHALAKLKHAHNIDNPITVCHVNHGLSQNACAWQQFAEQACQKLALPLMVRQVSIQAQAQQSLEALARDARYQALQSIYKEASLIITGHHCDDQAETFLLALKRGAGLKGLSAMAVESKLGSHLLVRPLLNISRTQITDYANSHGITWVEDESNTDTRFDRNFIRNDIMPLLTKRWPSIAKTINRSSEHCREGQVLLDELAAEDVNICQVDVKKLSVELLNNLSVARFNNLIRYFLALNSCLMPSTEQLAQLHQQLNANDDKNPAVKVGRHYFRRYKGTLYLTTDFNAVSDWQCDITLFDIDSTHHKAIIDLPDNLGQLNFFCAQHTDASEKGQFVVLPKKTSKITLRFNHDNPTCLPDYRQHSRHLKKVLQELNIPPWQRKRIPFLYYDEVLVAAIGYFVCQDFLAKKNEPSIRLTWTPVCYE